VIFAEMANGLTFSVRQPSHVESDSLLPGEGESATFSLHPQHTVVVRRDLTAEH